MFSIEELLILGFFCSSDNCRYVRDELTHWESCCDPEVRHEDPEVWEFAYQTVEILKEGLREHGQNAVLNPEVWNKYLDTAPE